MVFCWVQVYQNELSGDLFPSVSSFGADDDDRASALPTIKIVTLLSVISEHISVEYVYFIVFWIDLSHI